MSSPARFLALIVPLFLAGCVTSPAETTRDSEPLTCAGPGQWQALPSGEVVSANQAIKKMSKAKVILLGEAHTRRDHHQWQLHTLAALYGYSNKIAIGFEMFPRKSQAALDDWTKGKSNSTEFLKASRWNQVWRIDPSLYMPLLDFVRLNRLPAKALNVERSLNKAIIAKGWDQVPQADREGVSTPARPPKQYVDWLFEVYKQHVNRSGENDETAKQEDQGFQFFVQSQTLWDRAMAEAIAESLKEDHVQQVISIIGSGHVAGGFGVAHQLKSLGVTNIALAMPIDSKDGCDSIERHDADFVFYSEQKEEAKTWKPLLGVMLMKNDEGVKAIKVSADSVAEKAGVKKDDIFLQMAGVSISEIKDVLGVIHRQAPGTWLPITIRRNNKQIDFIAKFPTGTK